MSENARASHPDSRRPEGEGEAEQRVEAVPRIAHEDDRRFRDVEETDNSIKTSKYTLLNFVPKSLFEQFRRLANIYFLVLSALMMIGTYAPKTFDSPLTPYSTFFPLCVVLAFTMVKEAFEDSKRHQSDMHTDNRPARRRMTSSSDKRRGLQDDEVRNAGLGTPLGSFSSLPSFSEVEDAEEDDADGLVSKKIRWADIRRGHIIRVRNKEPIPADLVVLATSEPEGICYVETSNIDGETNLKQRRAVVGLDAVRWQQDIAGVVAEAPNGRIHSFRGFVRFKDESKEVLPVDEGSFLLRGSSIQNVRWVDGIVIYTGRDSKLAKNSAKPRLKLSSVEKTMNRLIRMVFAWLFLMVFVSTSMLCYLKAIKGDDEFPYLRGSGSDFSFPTPIAYFFTFLILFSNALPMSLYVTVEMVNFGQAFFIDNDQEMYDDESDTAARAVTSNLNSDLGQVEFIFSDKTGTLTRNVMTLKRCSVGGQIFGRPLMDKHHNDRRQGDGNHENTFNSSNTSREHDRDNGSVELERLSEETSEVARWFLTCLSVAHTVQLEEDGISYRAESPDEKALCEGARDLGREFLSRSGNLVTVKCGPAPQDVESWRVLAVNEFTSSRKRMSLIVRSERTGENVLLCKGADTVILAKSSSMTQGSEERRRIDAHLSEFANEGLRTLVLAMRRNLKEDEVNSWLKQFNDAKAAVEGRDEKLEKAAEAIEKDFEVLGATAIEDRLQDGVPETLEALREAGIKIWVLTGDKLETAINIGFSSRLLDSTMRVIRIEGKTKEDVSSQLNNVISLFPAGFGNHNGGIKTTTSSGATAASSRLTNIFARLKKTRLARAAELWRRSINETEIDDGDVERGRPLLERNGRNESSDSNARLVDDAERPLADSEEEPLALAITGQALEHALSDDHLKETLLTLALSCRVVIACRVSPGQKAQVVRLVKKGAHSDALGFSPVTLAIGDGANDVGMIQEAQVGIGISGKEGLQAVNASDFAISQFRFLKRLLLVHGRWSYRRMAKVILYSLYKNLVLVLLLFYYQFFAAFSGVSLFESMVQAGYNFFLGMCPLAVGLFDREISARFAMQNPQLYVSGRRNLNLNVIKLGWRVVEAFVHSAILFCLPVIVVQTNGFAVPARCHSLHRQDEQSFGGTPDLYVLGLTSYTCLIFVMQYKVLFEASSLTIFNAYAWIFSWTLYFVFLVVYSAWYWEAPEFYWVTFCALGRPTLWWLVFLCVFSAFVFDAAVRLGRLMFRPHAVDILIERDRLALKLLSVHEQRKRHNGQTETSFLGRDVGGFGERVRTALDINHVELMQRVHSLTPADLDAFGIDSPSLRSAFDFSAIDRLRSSNSGQASSSSAIFPPL